MELIKLRNYLSSGKNISDICLRVCIYARVSTDSFEQKKSLVNQVEYFKEYISLNPNWIYVATYIDDGVSGTSDIKRDNFMKMIDDAKDGLFDLIITKEISRFSRNTLDSIKYTRLLLSYGVCVFFVSDNINTIYSDSELRLTIMASLAQDEVRRLSERVKFGMNRAIMRGDILGNDMLYGYKKNKDTGCLVIIEDEAKIIREIFELYVYKNYSLGKIAKYLNTICGKKWYSTSISRIVENPKYKGFYCGKKSSVVNFITKKVEKVSKKDWIVYKDCEKVPPIVDENIWNLANKRLEKRKIKKKNKFSYQDRYLYSGKIFCGNDNFLYYRRTKENIIWCCSNSLIHGKRNCNSYSLNENNLNFIFLDLLVFFNIKLKDIVLYLKKLYCECNSASNRLYELLLKKVSLYSKQNKLLDLNINGLISINEFLNKKKFLDIENDYIDDCISIVFNSDYVINFDEIFINLDGYFIDKVISLLLEHIIVFSKNDGLHLNIYLNYEFNSFSKKYMFNDCFFYYVNFYSYK